jgi:hypothetical protein
MGHRRKKGSKKRRRNRDRTIPIDMVSMMKNGERSGYCKECGISIMAENDMIIHRRSRRHKRRVKELGERCHSEEDAEMAVGLYREGRPL